MIMAASTLGNGKMTNSLGKGSSGARRDQIWMESQITMGSSRMEE